ncbi:hypothetical protein J2T07_000418 [Luteibacter jiangsuensis]|uniref:Uncharacterized protein n=1 Tax=Luteibacter jiangsuensis TaxID=637577 RepID=A0ABT9SUP0_9GAMM|nr:hypothetical protein [Luteibacter jiangsuensis]MDQ0008259.1 hypothetical protein [Luteibacter jiangsuensis]
MSNGSTGHGIVFVYDEDGLFDIQDDASPYDLSGGIQASMAGAREGLVVSGFACSNDKNCK